MNHTLKEWVTLSGDQSLSEAVIAEETKRTGRSREQILEMMLQRLTIMKQSAQEGLHPERRSLSGLTGGRAAMLNARGQQALGGSLLGVAQAYALSVAECNATMGRIVAAPTAGACGVLPGALLAMQQERQVPDEKAVEALLVAAAVGEAIAAQASVSGAEGGCQAEIGTAAAMTAAALVYLEGGSAQQSADAAGFALMNLLGLVCDPVGGLVEIPCVYRNVGAEGIAFTAADLALSGIACPIPPDEIILAMKDVGEVLPASLRETGEGGCAACPSASKRCNMQDKY